MRAMFVLIGKELVTVPEASGGNAMIGICYLIKEDADIVERCIEELAEIKDMMALFGKRHCITKIV